MALSVRYRANRPLMGIGAGLIAFVLALGVVATTGYLNPHEQRNAALVRVAERVVTLELNLGAPSTGHALSFDSAYQPFRHWLVPGTQATDFTKWVLAQDLASAHAAPGLRLTRSHWWTRRVALIEPNHRYTTVVLSVYWWKKFRPSGESTGTANVAVNLQKTRTGWKANGVFWDSNPGAGPDQPDSFAYDLQHLSGATVPPQGDPPPLKHRANNP